MFNKVTWILGPQACGKTTKAYEMVKGKSYKMIDYRLLKDAFVFSDVTPNTDFILLDEVNKITPELLSFITAKEIVVNIKCKAKFSMPRPKLIITSSSFKQEDFRPRSYYEFIICGFEIKNVIQIDETKLDRGQVIANIKKLTTQTRLKLK